MKIKLSKRGGGFEADPVDLPGNPPIGRGHSIEEALGDFLIHYQQRLGIEIGVDRSAEAAETERRARCKDQR